MEPTQRSSRRRGRCLAVLLALTTLALPGANARADGAADEAELHFQLGAEDYGKGDFRGALEHFLLSNRLVPNRNVVFNIARAYEELKQLADAHRYYVDALQGETDPQVQAELQAALARVTPGVAVLDVETSPPGATIYVDRRDLGTRGMSPRPVALPPGTYRVLVELPGYEPASSEPIEAKAGAPQKVKLALTRIVGTVQIEGPEVAGVLVRVDDEGSEPACTAPCVIELPPGPHVLYFAKPGFDVPPRQVNVVARAAATVRVEPKPLTGSLVVGADERDALVTVDGRPMGFTPAVIQQIPVGKRLVRVSLRGFSPIERTVEIRPNAQSELVDLTLIPIREVTAVSRLAENIDDAPSSVSVLSSGELRAFAYPTIAEALRGVRGVYLSDDGTYQAAGIRGLGEPGDYGNRVLVLSDGQSLNDNLVNSSYIGSDGRTDLGDVERIEIVRGPGSLLYGTGAFSGVVNLVTRPRDEPTSVHVGGGVYDDSVARGRAGFHVNFDDDAGVWASVTGARSDGRSLPMRFAETGEDVVVPGVDAQRSGGTAGRAWWGPVTAQWFYHSRRQQAPHGAYETLLGDERTTFRDARAMGELRYEPKLGETVTLLTRAHASHYRYDGEFAYEEAPVPLNTEQYRGTWLGGEARVVWTPSARTRVTVGGEVQTHTQASIVGCCGEDAAGASVPYVDASQPYDFGAGYGVFEGSLSDWLRVSGGARVDAYSTFGVVFVPRLGLIFRPHEGGVLKVMGGRAFRAPSVYEQIYGDGGITQAAANDSSRGLELGPESTLQGEVEYSLRFKQDWVFLVAGHASRIQDIITSVEDTPGSDVVRYANSADRVLAIGADVELRRELRQGFMLSTMAGYQRAQYLGGDSGRLINSPEIFASAKGVAPLVQDVVTGAVRVTVEAPRRISLGGDETTPAAVIADLVLTGHARRYGIAYALGLYNVADWRQQVPMADFFAATTHAQKGRTVLADVTVTYP